MQILRKYLSILQFQGIAEAVKFASRIPNALSEDGQWVKLPGFPEDEIHITNHDVIRRNGNTLILPLHLKCHIVGPNDEKADYMADKIIHSMGKDYNATNLERHYNDMCFKFPFRGSTDNFGVARSYNQVSDYDIVPFELVGQVKEYLSKIFATDNSVSIIMHSRRYPSECDRYVVKVAGIEIPRAIYPYIQIVLASYSFKHPYKGFTMTTPSVWDDNSKTFKIKEGFITRCINDIPCTDNVFIIKNCIIADILAKSVYAELNECSDLHVEYIGVAGIHDSYKEYRHHVFR